MDINKALELLQKDDEILKENYKPICEGAQSAEGPCGACGAC